MAAASSGRTRLGLAMAIWALALIAGIALYEWDVTPRSGRYKAGGQGSGPGPARYLVMR